MLLLAMPRLYRDMPGATSQSSYACPGQALGAARWALFGGVPVRTVQQGAIQSFG